MKYLKRADLWRGPNATWSPVTMEAYSYAWWKFVARVEGKLVFNNYYYSATTRRHQAEVRGLLQSHGYLIDLEIPVPTGLGTKSLSELILEAEEHLCNDFLRKKLNAQDKYARTCMLRGMKSAALVSPLAPPCKNHASCEVVNDANG